MDLKKNLTELSALHGVSGNESAAAEYAAELLREYTDDIRIKSGNVIAVIKKPEDNRRVIVLDAHIDTVGFVVTSVEDGFAKVSDVGGLDMRLLSAQRVVIHGKEDLKGVICSVPPHLKKGGAKVPDISEIYIDLCGNDALVSAGDLVSFDVKPAEIIGNRITGGGLDDRCGMAAVLYALSVLDISDVKCGLTVVFSAQEEVGERGAAICAYDVNADTVIAVDASFAYSEGEKRSACGDMGKGCMIGFSPVLDRELSLKMKEIAVRENIPYQTEIMSEYTGTNADRYSTARGGAKCVTLSVPIKNMHTPAEIVDLTDIECTGKLIAEYIGEAGK